MKRIITLLAMLITMRGLSQHNFVSGNPDPIYLDSAGQKTTESGARSLQVFAKQNDNLWKLSTYRLFGPLIKIERFKDKGRTVLQGRTINYKMDGSMDAVQYFDNGAAVADPTLLADSRPLNTDSSAVIEPAAFKGGHMEWMRFMVRNFKFPDRAARVGINGTVQLQLSISETGTIDDVEIARSLEFSLDQEALRLIHESPKWIPASQHGIAVSSNAKLPMTFNYSRQP